MKEEIKQIRELLDKIETVESKGSDKSFKESFELFELPDIIASVVDYLQPLVSPYEMSIYWYMFRHSIVVTGDKYVRVSIIQIAKGTGSKFKSSDKSILPSDRAISENIRALESKNVIKKVGDTNREGTLYKINLPEEIEICKARMAEVQKQSLPQIDPSRELDFYNIKENRLRIFERDGYKCYKCGKQLTRFNATLDHIQPVSKGGDNSYNNLVTCCLHDNSRRGANPIMDQIIEK